MELGMEIPVNLTKTVVEGGGDTHPPSYTGSHRFSPHLSSSNDCRRCRGCSGEIHYKQLLVASPTRRHGKYLRPVFPEKFVFLGWVINMLEYSFIIGFPQM
jgi:hypothetical protein